LNSIPIYTIGYGNRSIGEFIELLERYGIQYLVDIRSKPYSRYNPDYSKDALEQHLKRHQIRYIFMGDTLGGRPDDRSCYTDDDIVDYALLRQKDFYQRGINRLRIAWEKELKLAIMCSEMKPQECHRGKLIGNTLIEQHIEVAHIDENGQIKGQDAINEVFTGGQLSLFDHGSPIAQNKKLGFSRKKTEQHIIEV